MFFSRKSGRKPKISLFLLIVFLLGASAFAYFYWTRSYERRSVRFLAARTLAGLNREFGEPFGIAYKDGKTYISDGEKGVIWKLGSNVAATVFASGLDTPSGIAFNKNGDLLVADSGSSTVKIISATGVVSNFAGVKNQSGDTDGDANTARFNAPVGVAVGDDGKVFVADTYNDRIRVIENGRVRTLAGNSKGFADGIGETAKFDTPCGLATLPDGRLLVADSGNFRIRIIDINGVASTLAGDGVSDFRDGLLSNASLVRPMALAVSSGGEIYIADGNSIRVIRQRIFPFVETISGNRRGFSDGKLTAAKFNRPSGLAFDGDGNLLIADSDNRVVRALATDEIGAEITKDQKESLRETPEQFRNAAPPRWPYDPPLESREIAGTLGEIRGEITGGDDRFHFHNGLDIAGAYGEKARFIRSEKVLLPFAAENFGTLRELIRMPQLGYIHIRLGRDQTGMPFGNNRFQFERDLQGKLVGVRIPRGSKFEAGDVIGTLNAMNHVHLIAGRIGDEMNALEALTLPGIADSRPPTVEKVSLFDENWHEIETERKDSRIKLTGKTRIVVRAYDQVDGNAERRRLGVFSIGYQILREDKAPVSEPQLTIRFDRMPPEAAIPFVYARGSKSGATGETIFNYIATNEVDGEKFSEDFLNDDLAGGKYILRVFVSDYFGNTTSKDINIEVIK